MRIRKIALRPLETHEINNILREKNLGNDKPSFKKFLQTLGELGNDWEAKMTVKVNRDGKTKTKWNTNTCNLAFKAINLAKTHNECVKY